MKRICFCPGEVEVKFGHFSFGSIQIEDTTYEHDMIIDRGEISIRDPLTALRMRLRELAQARIRYGYRKLRVLLIRDGWQVGKKLVYRCPICKPEKVKEH